MKRAYNDVLLQLQGVYHRATGGLRLLISCIERVCRSVGTLILCDFCDFRCKKTTKNLLRWLATKFKHA